MREKKTFRLKPHIFSLLLKTFEYFYFLSTLRLRIFLLPWVHSVIKSFNINSLKYKSCCILTWTKRKAIKGLAFFQVLAMWGGAGESISNKTLKHIRDQEPDWHQVFYKVQFIEGQQHNSTILLLLFIFKFLFAFSKEMKC